MKSVSISHTDLTLDTNITFSPFKEGDSICVRKPEEHVFEVYPKAADELPIFYLKKDEHLSVNLSFTIIFLMAIAIIRLRGKNLLLNLLNVALNRKKVEVIHNEGISPNLLYYLLALILSFSILSICICQFLSIHFFSTLGIQVLGGLFAYHFFMLASVHLLGWIFQFKNWTGEMVVNIWAYHILTGLLLSPFVIALFFVKSFAFAPLLKIIFLGLVVFIIIKIMRWVGILFQYGVSILYMILYLCVLEFMPLLFLYKVVAF